MKVSQELLQLPGRILKPMIAFSLCLLLVACDKGGFDLPPNTGKYPVTGEPPPNGDIIDPNIGLDGRWETYCEHKVKYTFEIKGDILKEGLSSFSDNACTSEKEGSPFVVEDTFSLKGPLTTSSGLTAYPIVSRESAVNPDQGLIVLHGDTLYWQRNGIPGNGNPRHPTRLDFSFDPFLDEFHRIQ